MIGQQPGGADLEPAQALLGVEAATKTFAEVQALRKVSLALYPGEVHGLVGGSGAGKSTLVKILGGEDEPDSGQYVVDGASTVLTGPAAARAVGASIIHQWPHLLPDMGVAENIFRGRHPIGAGPGFDRAEMRRQAGAIFARLGVELDPALPARGLSTGDKQLVEIARAISLNARVFLMDESTVPLNPLEIDRLFRAIRALRDDGAAVLFVSLRLDEIFEICRRVSIIRGGRLVRTAAIDEVRIDEVIHLAAGRELATMVPKAGAASAGVVLEVAGLAQEGVFSDVSFQVREGEVVALTGLAGAGCAELARAVFGTDRRDTGEVRVRRHSLPNGSSQAAIEAGVAFVPQDHSQPRWGRPLALRRGNKRAVLSARRQLDALAYSSARRPSVLIVDSPTEGVDEGTAGQVHWVLDDLAVDGVAILMVSSDPAEVLAMADRILVFHGGTLTAELAHAEADEASIMRAAMGGSHYHR